MESVQAVRFQGYISLVQEKSRHQLLFFIRFLHFQKGKYLTRNRIEVRAVPDKGRLQPDIEPLTVPIDGIFLYKDANKKTGPWHLGIFFES